MRILCAALAVNLMLVGPLQAQIEVPGTEHPAEPAPVVPEASEPTPLVEMFERLLRRFMTDVEPQLRAFERGIAGLEPEMQRLLGELRDMTQYHPPEVLPNGDILIRRRQFEDLDVAPDSDAPESDVPSAEVPFEL